MIRLGLLALLAVTATHCADHGTFKDCSRVDFCTEFRNTPLNDIYTADAGSLQTGDNSVKITLKANNGASDLVLTLNGVEGNIFRARFAEPDSSRYELKDVLVREPPTTSLNVENGDGSVTVTDNSGNSATINFSPFSVRLIKAGVGEVVSIDGSKLNVKRNNVNAPFRVGFTFPNAVQIYGVHEHADNIALRNTNGVEPYRLKNSDVAYYELNSPMALYGAVPVLYGHGPKATAGVFLQNAAEQWIEINNNGGGNSEGTFYAETGAIDIFVLLGPTPTEVIRQYTSLTGTAHLPQLWTLGYHQSRYSYDSQDDVKNVLENFDSHDFQLDAIWLDIDYTDGFKYFTWNPGTFSDPVGLQQTIESQNRKLITIIDPHIKAEPGYFVYDGALQRDLFVKNNDGSVFQGPCWPGMSSYMDFLNPEARSYYGSMYSYENFKQSTSTIGGIWNDMNEPSVFDTSLEMTLPADSLHNGNVRHREIHNIYGFLHTMATHQGLMERDNGQLRPFVLTRSHFAGSQRYAAIWTGDNTADWGYLGVSYTECLNANIMGIVFCGADVGGFFNNPDNELFSRWYQAGAWLPFYRAHSVKDSARREPYLMPDDVQNRVRTAIETRYQHLPLWYTTFYEHVRNGDPVIRPLFYQYPEDTNVLNLGEQLLVGSNVLVRAVSSPGVASVSVYFPGGEGEQWVSLDGNDVRSGSGAVDIPVNSEFIPVYYRKGSIIPKKVTKRRSSAEMANDPYSFEVVVDSSGQAQGTLYLDDNQSFNYENGDYSYYNLVFNGNSVDISRVDGNGNYDVIVDSIKVKTIQVPSKNGSAGQYTTQTYKTDVNGVLLKDIKFQNGKAVLKLK